MFVLYVEDDVDDYFIFTDVLKTINPEAKCINARNGQEALKMLESMAQLPDLIFLDINMPLLDGKGCLKALKNDGRLKNIPVVVYTTSRNPKDKEQCLQLGVMAFVQKPNTISETIAIMGEFLKPKDGR